MDEQLNAATPLRGLINIGPTIADRLAAVGLHTVGDLRRAGPAEAFLRVRAAHPQTNIPVCYYLYSLEGALHGIAWNDLDAGVKARLCAEAGVPFRAARHDQGRLAANAQPQAAEPPVQRAAEEIGPQAAHPPATAYQALVAAMQAYPGVTLGAGRRGFGANALRWNGAIFAMLVKERLVVKLPRGRVAALASAGCGAPLDQGHGRLMQEWLSVAPTATMPWVDLAHEALAFVSGSP